MAVSPVLRAEQRALGYATIPEIAKVAGIHMTTVWRQVRQFACSHRMIGKIKWVSIDAFASLHRGDPAVYARIMGLRPQTHTMDSEPR